MTFEPLNVSRRSLYLCIACARNLFVGADNERGGRRPSVVNPSWRRLAGGPAHRDDLREFARTLAPAAREPARGPAAILASDSAMYARGCAYAAMVTRGGRWQCSAIAAKPRRG